MKNSKHTDERDVPAAPIKRKIADVDPAIAPAAASKWKLSDAQLPPRSSETVINDNSRDSPKGDRQTKSAQDTPASVPSPKDKVPEASEVPSSSKPERHPIVPAKEPTIFCTRPVDDIVLYIADLLKDHCDKEYVEIEAKLGVFIDKHTQQRINMGAVTETGIVRFEANMPDKQHRHFNELLNRRVEASNKQGYKGEHIRYKHTHEKDSFFQGNTTRGDKWRVTTDEKTGKVKPGGIIEKQRIMNINIHVPKQPLDYRISINLELPRPPPAGNAVYARHKDRVSYTHAGIQFDLTQVKGGSERDAEVRHELELEIINPKDLAREKRKGDRREPSQYTDMVESFVNNVRMMCRHALKMHHFER